MAQYAGQMQAVAGDPGFVPATGRLLTKRGAPDYVRRTGRKAGHLGYAVRLPTSPGWEVRLADDAAAADLPGAPTASASPPALRIDPFRAAYYASPDNPGAARVNIRGWVRPYSPVQWRLTTNGTPGSWGTLTSSAVNGRIDTFINLPVGSDYAVEFRVTALPAVVLGPYPINTFGPAAIAVFDPVARTVPQGTYNATGSISPPTASITCAIRRWDGSSVDAPVSVTAGRFTASPYLQDPGEPYWLEISRGAELAGSSSQFAVVRAIEVSGIPATVWITAPASIAQVSLTGRFLGTDAETAEVQIVVNGTPGGAVALPLLRGADGRHSFSALINVTPGTGYQLRVRKTQNPGVYTDSNLFAVRRTN